ncbi:MAG: His/Gly/Thr/Pro-type tRNA ligase C-terminal domain-containing protein, partial [Planctomycetota bacterium]
LGTQLRREGVNTEVFLEGKKLGAQMKYANKKGIAFVVLADGPDLDAGQAKLRNMETGDQVLVAIEELSSCIAESAQIRSRT